MQLAPWPLNEFDRLTELLQLEILDTGAEGDYDEIVRLAAEICETPIALFSLVDQKRQWFKARVGLEPQETPREISFCSHSILQDELFVVGDASHDHRFKDNPLVVDDPKIKFYAGQPIRTRHGARLGTICVIDRVPRQLNQLQQRTLAVLGNQIERLLELRMHNRAIEQRNAFIKAQYDELNALHKIREKTMSVLAHDLRSPLSSIQQIMNLLHENVFSADELLRLIQKVQPDLDENQRNLDHILQWARTQMQSPDADVRQVDLVPMVIDSLSQIEPTARRKGISLYARLNGRRAPFPLEPPPTQPIYVRAQPNTLVVTLRNLCGNAVKYSRAGDEIILKVEQNEEGVAVSVTDTGVGMPPDKLAAVRRGIAEPTPGTEYEKGLGVGFSLCRSLLAGVKSKLHIESTLGQGTVASFALAR